MAAQAVTLNLPASLYDPLKRRAEQAHRSLEAELLEVVATSVPMDENLPPDLSQAVSALATMEDDELWRVARSHFPIDAATQLEALHLKQQRESLTEREVETLSHLVHQYERAMLVRAQATLLLKQRGHDISLLITEE